MALQLTTSYGYIGEAMNKSRRQQDTRARRPILREADYGPLAMPMPVFLVIWLVCAIVAAISWDNLVTTTPAANGQLTISFLQLVVLGTSFGLPGAGLVSFAVGIIRNR
jgi:hypothetical protein